MVIGIFDICALYLFSLKCICDSSAWSAGEAGAITQDSLSFLDIFYCIFMSTAAAAATASLPSSCLASA